jgi:hypothetical protein
LLQVAKSSTKSWIPGECEARLSAKLSDRNNSHCAVKECLRKNEEDSGDTKWHGRVKDGAPVEVFDQDTAKVGP